MVEHHQTLDRGGTSSNVGSNGGAYVGIELISAAIPICCGLPLAIESFSLITELATPLGKSSF
jgi:hypothetical protein